MPPSARPPGQLGTPRKLVPRDRLPAPPTKLLPTARTSPKGASSLLVAHWVVSLTRRRRPFVHLSTRPL